MYKFFNLLSTSVSPAIPCAMSVGVAFAIGRLRLE